MRDKRFYKKYQRKISPPYRWMFGAFVVKFIIFLVWRIRNRWRPFVRENRARVHHWLLLLMSGHYLRVSTVIYKYSKMFSRHITFFISCENAKIRSHSRHDPPCFRHHSDNDSRKTPDTCKWRIWDCAQGQPRWSLDHIAPICLPWKDFMKDARECPGNFKNI